MATEVATSFEQLDTPVLLLDLDIMERNLQDIAAFANQQGIDWRPHIKTHKCVEIAKKQIEYGACGITVAKVSEAEVMAKAGITDILIACPLSSPLKLKKVASLLPLAKIKLAVDSPKQAERIHQFFEHSSTAIDVWIKVDTGLHRCGVEPGKETVLLAKEISKYSKLNLQGLFTHAGHAYASSGQEMEKIGLYEGQAIAESAEWCEKEGIPIRHRSVGSTPTFRISGKVPGITEVRPGNAVFFDAIQVGLGVATFDQCALRLLSSVVSIRPNEKRLILDTGSKSLSLDQGAHGNASVNGYGHVVNHPELTIQRLSEEHGIVSINQQTNLDVTDRVQIIPNHACTVVNLFDSFVLTRKGTIVGEWRIDARGKVQ
jgi:D-serine deaminase-like pyridoxal phosphate-dependent protein